MSLGLITGFIVMIIVWSYILFLYFRKKVRSDKEAK